MECENHEKEQCMDHAGARPGYSAGVPCHPPVAGAGAEFFFPKVTPFSPMWNFLRMSIT